MQEICARFNIDEYKQSGQSCECKNWVAPLSTIVFQHKPACSSFDRDFELSIMADELWRLHLEKIEASMRKADD